MDTLKVMQWPRTPLQKQSDDLIQRMQVGLVLKVDDQGRSWFVRPDPPKDTPVPVA